MLEVRPSKICSRKLCTIQLCVPKTGAPQFRAFQVRAPEVCPIQTRVPEFGSAQICIAKVELMTLIERLRRLIAAQNRQIAWMSVRGVPSLLAGCPGRQGALWRTYAVSNSAIGQ